MERKMKIVWHVGVLLLIGVGSCFGLGQTALQTQIPTPTYQWGGPYTPRTYGGQDISDPTLAIQWKGDKLEIPSHPDLWFGMTYSIEIHAGTYTLTTNCIYYLDLKRNGGGDYKNKPLEYPDPKPTTVNFTFEQDAWALVVIPPGVTDCSIVKAKSAK
jgi:hypothetical protein